MNSVLARSSRHVIAYLTLAVLFAVALYDIMVLQMADSPYAVHLAGDLGYNVAFSAIYALGYFAVGIPLLLTQRALLSSQCIEPPFKTETSALRSCLTQGVWLLASLILCGLWCGPLKIAGIPAGGYTGYTLGLWLMGHLESVGTQILVLGMWLASSLSLLASSNWYQRLPLHRLAYDYAIRRISDLKTAKTAFSSCNEQARVKIGDQDATRNYVAQGAPLTQSSQATPNLHTASTQIVSSMSTKSTAAPNGMSLPPDLSKIDSNHTHPPFTNKQSEPARVEPAFPPKSASLSNIKRNNYGSKVGAHTHSICKSTSVSNSNQARGGNTHAQGSSSSKLSDASRAVQYPNNQDLPSLALLHKSISQDTVREDPKRIEMLRSGLEAKLADFSVEAKVVHVELGPVISRFEAELAPGIKASKVTALAKDIARSLSVDSVRVVEVIPGKSCIGIEIPNHKRTTVSLDAVFDSETFKSAVSPLTLGLGVDISGNAVAVDLCKMPHLLVAGTTGSGKSVGLNAFLLSLLFRAGPEELRLILIDPKMLEFAVYEGIPHLLTPVVTDMKDAASALGWCVQEMERRYKVMAQLGVRNILSYNQKLDQLSEHEKQGHEKLPYVVVMADEFADMMMMVGKKVEQLIARLAQKARAAGIHLILATQRPSVDVITGLIKANIPTRVAFQVSSKIDSRTIIDQQGAETLLGSGDMLYLSPGSCVPVRCHGAYVSDDTIAEVVKHLRSTGPTNYIEEILHAEEQSMQLNLGGQLQSGGSEGVKSDKALFDEAVDWVVRSRKVSISSVQRRLRIGYNRAATLVESMQDAGIVSVPDASGNRKVLAPEPSV